MSVRTRILIAMLGLLMAPARLAAQEKSLARTPPMGWNRWNKAPRGAARTASSRSNYRVLPMSYSAGVG